MVGMASQNRGGGVFTHSPLGSRRALGHALVVGVGVGMIAVGFARLTAFVQSLLGDGLPSALSFMAPWSGMLAPVLGAGVCLLVSLALLRRAGGHGVPEVMAGVAFHGGHLNERPLLVRGGLAAVAIGSGLSVGPEGPMVQLGAALGSLYGRVFRVTSAQQRMLVAAGAAAGIAAIFNAPLAGVFFALEALLMELRVESLAYVVLAAVAASVTGRAFMGDHPAFLVPQSRLVSPLELLFYAVLGLAAALIGVLFIRVLYAFEDAFHKLPVPAWSKPLLGALLVGLLGLGVPAVLGSGHAVIEEILYMMKPWRLLVWLLPLKVLATALSVSSGNPGGIFAPSLVLGAALGGLWGYGVHALWPSVTAAPPAYALVGMAALLTATVRAPIAAVFLIFEMTRDYTLVLPLMLSTTLALVLAQALEAESVYTLALQRQGIDLRAGRDFDVMREILVRDVMTPVEALVQVAPSTPVPALLELFERTHHHGLPVVDAEGALCGMVTLQDVERALQRGAHQATALEIATRDVRVTFPDETLASALRHFAERDIGRVPVVDRHHPRRLVGMLRRANIVCAYAQAAHGLQERHHAAERQHLAAESPLEIAHLTLHEADAACGRRLRELRLPVQALLTAIERGHTTLIPDGETVLLPGDRCWVLARADDFAAVERYLRKGEV